MKKSSFLLLLLSLLISKVNAQLKHQIGVGSILYSQLFSNQVDKLFPEDYFKYWSPTINYTVEKGKNSLNLYSYVVYKWYPAKEQALSEYYNAAIGINYGYQLYNNKKLSLKGLVGVNYSRNRQVIVLNIYSWEPILEGILEWDGGLQTGINAQYLIWKGAFAYSNLRYNIYPWQSKAKTNQNLLLEIGLGYSFQKKK